MTPSDTYSKRKRSISPPLIKRKKPHSRPTNTLPTPATVESGHTLVKDHLKFYSDHFSSFVRLEHALLGIPEWQALYRRNQHGRGHHFVIHQHDHPVAGTHYDLRLQINETSSCSWAIMYGLPGNPNSTRLNRNATETRIHCLWNHLVESASHTTGSLLIWDTGEYEVVSPSTDDEETTGGESECLQEGLSEPEKLAAAFARNKIRLRLHGSRLPNGYVLYIRRPQNAKIKDRPPSQQRKRKVNRLEIDGGSNEVTKGHSDTEEDATIRRNNAYPGATNSIGSIHQRTWFASMDRVLSGFQKTRQNGETIWTKRSNQSTTPGNGRCGFEPFVVRGREHERSVVTGRSAMDVMQDEGVVGFTPRPGWRAVLD